MIGDKFKVEQVLGSGGVGVVVAARHLQLDERVALKFLLPEAVRSEVDIARFCREAQASVRLRSEHVARVTDVGTLESGSPYMVMEYLVGMDLSEVLLEKGPLPPPVAIDYVLQACEAIAEAHSIGFVHRDIKPSNLFLTHRSDGSPLIKVLDFGIAKATHQARIGEGQQELTRTKTMLGSPMYMSPEQVRNSKTVDARSDIWSIGVVLYELLSGKVPFEADSVTGVVAAVVGDPFPPLQVHRPGLPDSLADVVATCLQKRPDDRYQSVAELAYALAPHAVATSRLSVDRIAGTLGIKGKVRAQAILERRGGSMPLVAATTVKSGENPRPRRTSTLVGAAAIGFVAVSALALAMYSTSSKRMEGPTETGQRPSASALGPEPAERAAPPLVVPAEPVTAPPSVPSDSAASTGAPSSPPAAAPAPTPIGVATTPHPSPVRLRGAAPMATPASRPAPPPSPSPRGLPARAPSATPPVQESTRGSGVIDTTVDTRR